MNSEASLFGISIVSSFLFRRLRPLTGWKPPGVERRLEIRLGVFFGGTGGVRLSLQVVPSLEASSSLGEGTASPSTSGMAVSLSVFVSGVSSLVFAEEGSMVVVGGVGLGDVVVVGGETELLRAVVGGGADKRVKEEVFAIEGFGVTWEILVGGEEAREGLVGAMAVTGETWSISIVAVSVFCVGAGVMVEADPLEVLVDIILFIMLMTLVMKSRCSLLA